MKKSDPINVILPEKMLQELEAVENSRRGLRVCWDPDMDTKIALVLFFEKKTKAALAEYFDVCETTMRKYYQLWKADPQVLSEIERRQVD